VEDQPNIEDKTVEAQQDKPPSSKGVEVSAEEGEKEDNVDEEGRANMPTSSSVKYTPPSTSNDSGQASSLQESLHESDAILEATAGGP
jgi:hypothetical protein